METSAEEIVVWLKRYKEWGDKDQIPGTEVLFRGVTNYDTICNFDFGDKHNILHIAIQRNHRNIIAQLINAFPTQSMVDMLNMENRYGSTPMLYVAYFDRIEILTDLLSFARAVNVSVLHLLLGLDGDDSYAAHYVAAKGNKQMLEIMLESLTDSEERLQLLISRDRLTETVLYKAVGEDKIRAVEYIISNVTGDQLFQLINAKEEVTSATVLDEAVANRNPKMICALMGPLTDLQRLEVLEIRRLVLGTAKDFSVGLGYPEVTDRIDIIAMESMVNIITTGHLEVKQKLLGEIVKLPLTSQHIRELHPHSTKYVIPCNQKNVRQQALIFYNKDDRDGAEDEADNLSECLDTAGCDVIKRVWSKVSDLQYMIDDHILQTRHTSSVLVLCLMSHGSMGCLQGSDGTISINDILKQICDIFPQQVPLVVVIQACQGSRFSMPHHETMPETSSMLVSTERASDPPATYLSMSAGDMKIDVTRPHTVLLQATVTGGVAYRGEYTGALADQFRRSNSNISIEEMHKEAVIEMERSYGSEQNPKITSTLKKHLLLLGPQHNDIAMKSMEKSSALMEAVNLIAITKEGWRFRVKEIITAMFDDQNVNGGRLHLFYEIMTLLQTGNPEAFQNKNVSQYMCSILGGIIHKEIGKKTNDSARNTIQAVINAVVSAAFL